MTRDEFLAKWQYGSPYEPMALALNDDLTALLSTERDKALKEAATVAQGASCGHEKDVLGHCYCRHYAAKAIRALKRKVE